MLHQVRLPVWYANPHVVYSSQSLDRKLGRDYHDHSLIVVRKKKKRKMMSALVLSSRTGTPADIIDEVESHHFPGHSFY